MSNDALMSPAVAKYANDIAEVLSMKATVQDLLKSQMKEDVHFGKIPGTGDKPTLLKPGAEMLRMVFSLRTLCESSDIHIAMGNCSTSDDNHKTYTVTIHIYKGEHEIATGMGNCSTMESKYRFRTQATDRRVPKEYWDTRDKALLGGSQFSPKKVKGQWMISERMEHDNPADYYNTCMKMAKKRAMADGILTATGSSDLFTQDLEDLNANFQVYDGVEEKKKIIILDEKRVERESEDSQKTVETESPDSKLLREEDIFHYYPTGDMDTDFLLKTIHDVAQDWDKVKKIWPKVQSQLVSITEENQVKIIAYKDMVKSFHVGTNDNPE